MDAQSDRCEQSRRFLFIFFATLGSDRCGKANIGHAHAFSLGLLNHALDLQLLNDLEGFVNRQHQAKTEENCAADYSHNLAGDQLLLCLPVDLIELVLRINDDS